jgi:hypothetical protein
MSCPIFSHALLVARGAEVMPLAGEGQDEGFKMILDASIIIGCLRISRPIYGGKTNPYFRDRILEW